MDPAPLSVTMKQEQQATEFSIAGTTALSRCFVTVQLRLTIMVRSRHADLELSLLITFAALVAENLNLLQPCFPRADSYSSLPHVHQHTAKDQYRDFPA